MRQARAAYPTLSFYAIILPMEQEQTKKTEARYARFFKRSALLFACALFLFALARLVLFWGTQPASTPAEPVPTPLESPPQSQAPLKTPALTPLQTPETTPDAPEESPAPPAQYIKTAVVIDGKTAGVLASREAAEELLYDIKTHYEGMIDAGGLALSSAFSAEVALLEAGEGVELTTLEALYEKLVNGRRPLEVRTTLVKEEQKTVSHKEKTVKDDTLLTGLRVVESMGRAGKVSLVTRVIYVNGKEKKTEKDAETVLRTAVDRVVRVGTLAQKNGEPGRSEGEKGESAGTLSFAPPLSGKVVSNFGRRDGSYHFGLDYEAKQDESVLASEKGVVVSLLVRGAYGLTLEIDHGGGFLTRYAHLGAALVSLGDAVEKGQAIAAPGEKQHGENGNLHFELRHNGFALNPRYYLP